MCGCEATSSPKGKQQNRTHHGSLPKNLEAKQKYTLRDIKQGTVEQRGRTKGEKQGKL